MRIVVGGASGLIGAALCDSLTTDGHEVQRLVRRETRDPDEIAWDPARGEVDAKALKAADGVVNLAGAGVGDRRWTDEYKQVIRDSRIDSTRLIAETLAAIDPRPQVLVNASASGIYGPDRGDEILDESSALGRGFLADLVRDWEAATAPAQAAGVRVATLRTGLVMTRHGGALQRQLPFFRLGLGGPLGRGRQWWSHVSLVDTVRAIRFLLECETCSGPYDVTAPEPVTNAEFTRVLARALGRPALLPVPPPALQIYLGEFAQDVLGSLRILPTRLIEAGFTFEHPDAESVVRAAL